MDIINKIIGGVHSDNDPNQQPEHTMRMSRNGVILDVGEGNYVWEPMKGTSISFTLAVGSDQIMGWCTVRDRFIIIVYRVKFSTISIYEVNYDADGIGILETLWSGSSSELGISTSHPIRAMFGFYESQEIQRIYLTDFYNNPMVINIGYEDPLNKLVTIAPKFLPFTPEIEGAYGSFILYSILSGGYLRAGSYFFCWRYINKDYYSDWSYLSSPINIGNGSIGVLPDTYQQFQGKAPNSITTKAIRLRINGLDTDYSSIQIAAFYSNDYNSAEPGMIFYDGELTGSEITVNFYGTENAGTVTLEEILETTIVIDRCRDMLTTKKLNILANIKTRSELNVKGLNVQGKDNQIDCEMSLITRDVILDVTGYQYIADPYSSTEKWANGWKGLFQSPKSIPVSVSNPNMYCGVQYMGLMAGGADLDDGGTITWVPNQIFTLPDTETTGAICTSGTCNAVIALRKYRKSTAGPTPTWEDYEWLIKPLTNEYMDYKSPVISSMIRSYPGGETVRLGLLAIDKTGRPFFVRWLNNKDATLGLGDPIMPKRNNQAGNVPLTAAYDLSTTGASGDIYSQLNGRSIGISISNLDLTDIIDDISAFMIVRAPIIHQYIGYGLLNFSYHSITYPNNIMMGAGYIGQGTPLDGQQQPEVYGFLCPEDQFNFKDFIIQPGDLIENHQYLYPYLQWETYSNGYGRASNRKTILPNGDNGFDIYQKYVLPNAVTTPGGSNSTIGTTHEVLYSTKYEPSSGGIVFDPRNEALEYQDATAEYHNSAFKGSAGRHNILMLDIDESGNNPKGEYASTTPRALLCSIKRPTANPYSGTDDSSLANTLYMAIGHFQVIDDNVKADIESGGKYIFNEIEVFGGDHYICLYNEQRIVINRNVTPGNFQMGHGIIFPVESRVNIGLREGIHFAKDRAYQEALTTNGIRFEVGNYVNEEYNYNDGYSSDDINDYYLPFPFNTTLLDTFDVQMRHSLEKTHGERRDSFRIFNTLDKLNLDSSYGELMNIKAKYNRIIYWQRDAVGYVPIHERALTQTAFGDPVQLGVGGVFERYDEMTDRIGNSNQFGLVESDMGFHWYDAKRKLYLSLTEALKFSQDSIAKGLNNWLNENVDTEIIDYDVPTIPGGRGICGGYDPDYKMVFHSFFNPISGTSRTIGYDIRQQKYMGEFDMPGMFWMRYKNLLISVKKEDFRAFVHGKGSRTNIYGVDVNAEIQIVIRDPNHTALHFDNYELLGNDKFFEQITIENSEQLTTEIIQSDASGTMRFLNDHYKYRNRRWYASFPRFQETDLTATRKKERFVDGYLIVTFKALPGLTKFVEMKTEVRKAF